MGQSEKNFINFLKNIPIKKAAFTPYIIFQRLRRISVLFKKERSGSYITGFTLVELLVVIAIVGLLSTIVLVSTSGLREQAEIAKTLQWAKSIDSLLGADAVGIWNMDENPASQGTIIKDLSGWGNNGTFNTGEVGVNKSMPGVVGNAISFDGVDDYVEGPNLLYWGNSSHYHGLG
jgi:prepilin-type N-terminal cleavage/methylation domain-containing protein